MVLLVRRHLQLQLQLHLYLCSRSFLIGARVPWVRDRALDHAVEKEKHLLPYQSLKNQLINKSKSEAIPLSSLNSVRLPFRPLRFLRLFPSSFLESFPSQSSPLQPHFSPSPSLLHLHSQELLLYKSCLQDAADRLLRLLMLSPSRSIPLPVVHSLRWDLALPLDFPLSLLPLYPDYFRISHDHPHNILELVCYSPHLAVSRMETYAAKTGGYTKGMPLAFPLSYPRGFEMDKKVRKWVEDWQKLPYVSPYEDGVGLKLPRKSEVWEKWVVGVLHEFLSLCIGRKTEKANIEMLAPYLGLPAGIGKVIRNYPGIFYVSNKLRTQTVVLREAYRRDLLLEEEKNPFMGMRYQYIHLMREGRKERKSKKSRKNNSSRRRGDDNVDNNSPADAGEYDDFEEEDEYVEGDEEDDEISDDEESDDDDDDDESEDYYEDAGQKSVQQGPQGIIRFGKMEPGGRRGMNTRKSNSVGRKGHFDMQRNNNSNTEMQRDDRKLYGRGGRAPGMGYSPRGNQRLN